VLNGKAAPKQGGIRAGEKGFVSIQGKINSLFGLALSRNHGALDR